MLRVDLSRVKHELTDGERSLMFPLGVAAMTVGLPEITEKNLVEWGVRVGAYERLFGGGFVSRGGEPASLVPLLPRFVGAAFNVAAERRSTFLRRMGELLERDVKRGER
jgi:hypothetical protein